MTTQMLHVFLPNIMFFLLNVKTLFLNESFMELEPEVC